MTSRRARRSIRLTLLSLVVPLGLAAAGCQGGLTDSPTTTNQPTTTQEIVAIVGRPLRKRNGRFRRARSRRGHSHLTDRQALRLAPAVRAALGEHWRAQGEMEHASVIAFHDLARRLSALDAPIELRQRATRAGGQEADHAQRCFDLAGRYLGDSLLPGRLHRPIRLPRSREIELARLAVESLRDGVLNEGYAAWLAGQQAARATDPRVRDTLDVIARDEADHADLSADVLSWCLDQGGEAVAHAVLAAAGELPVRMVACARPKGVSTRALADHGLFDPDPDGSGYAEVLAATMAYVPCGSRAEAA